MGDLADSIITELRQKFDRHPVWVWYDAQEKYKGVLDEVEAALDNVTLARYDGIELKRRLCIDDPTARHRTSEKISKHSVDLDLLFGHDDVVFTV